MLELIPILIPILCIDNLILNNSFQQIQWSYFSLGQADRPTKTKVIFSKYFDIRFVNAFAFSSIYIQNARGKYRLRIFENHTENITCFPYAKCR